MPAILPKAATVVPFAVSLVGLFASPAFAATTATPDPAVPNESVTLRYDSKICASAWRNLASLDEGVLAVDWPDGTQTLVDPVTDPVVVVVPDGMTTGTATISLHKGFIGNGEYEDCRGTFEIVEDATTPVADPVVGGLFIVSTAGVFVAATSRKRTGTSQPETQDSSI